jgi:hypothetical protein
MGNITETTHFENLQADLEADVMDENMRWVDELTEASYESEVDLDRDMPTEVEQMEADAELYFEGMGHA